MSAKTLLRLRLVTSRVPVPLPLPPLRLRLVTSGSRRLVSYRPLARIS